jgi:hypothetical protein
VNNTDHTTTAAPAPQTISDDQLEALPIADSVQVGDIVVARIRNRNRVAIVRKVGRVNATVECHTPSGYAEAVERGTAVHNIASILLMADDQDAQADKYEACAAATEQCLSDGSLDRRYIDGDWLHWTQLPSPLRELTGAPGNVSGETMCHAPEQYRQWAADARAAAAKIRTERVPQAEARNAIPMADRIAQALAGATTTKTVKLAELRTAA